MEVINQNQTIQQLINDRHVRIQATRESHYLFFHVYLGEYVKYETANFQREMFRITEDETIKNAVIVAFRGSSKSTSMTLSYPLWAIMGKLEKRFVLILSQTQQQAKLIMSNIRRELEGNQLLRQELGPFEDKDNEWGSTSIVIPRFDARITVASAGQSIRGIKHGSHRPDLIIFDDVEDLDSVKTKEGRDGTYNWFSGEVIPAGDINTKVIIIGNLLHEDSLLMRLRGDIEKGKWSGIYRSFPLINDQDEILWPGKFKNMDDVEKLRRSVPNENAWQREYMLHIVSEEDQLIFSEWIQYYDFLPPEKPNHIIVGVDLAISETNSADYTAMVTALVYGTGKNAKIYILPNPVNKRMDFPRTTEAIDNLYESLKIYGSPKIYVEDVGYQKIVPQHLRSLGIKAEGVAVHGQDKRSRLALTTDYILSGRVRFPVRGAEHLISQLVGFGKEKHDDLVDAFSIAIGEAINKTKTVEAGFLITRGWYD